MLETNGKLVYELELPVRWYDMDAFGHVNTSVYFTYFESARLAWFTEIAPKQFEVKDTGPVVIKASCTFLKSIIYPEVLNVMLYAAPPGRSSFETYYIVKSKTFLPDK